MDEGEKEFRADLAKAGAAATAALVEVKRERRTVEEMERRLCWLRAESI